MFIVWKAQHNKDLSSLQHRFTTISIKIPSRFFFLKFIWKGKGIRIGKATSKKQNKMGGLNWPSFKIVWYWQRDKHTDQ